mgnify:CR=1 FL=1
MSRKDNPVPTSQSLVCPPGLRLVGQTCLPEPAAAPAAAAPAPAAAAWAKPLSWKLPKVVSIDTINGNGQAEELIIEHEQIKPTFPWGAAALAVLAGLVLSRRI